MIINKITIIMMCNNNNYPQIQIFIKITVHATICIYTHTFALVVHTQVKPMYCCYIVHDK